LIRDRYSYLQLITYRQ